MTVSLAICNIQIGNHEKMSNDLTLMKRATQTTRPCRIRAVAVQSRSRQGQKPNNMSCAGFPHRELSLKLGGFIAAAVLMCIFLVYLSLLSVGASGMLREI